MAGGRQIMAQVILSLIDRASGPAKNVAGALKQAEGAVTSLANSDKKFDGWGNNFQRSLDRMKLSARDLHQIKAEFDRVGKSLREMDLSPRQVSQGMTAWKNGVISNLVQVQQQARRTQEALNGALHAPGRALRRGAGFAAGALGVGGAAVSANRLGQVANAAGGDIISNDTRARLGGLTPEQIRSINARSLSLSRQYPSLTMANMQESLRDLAQSMGGRFGGVDKALQIADSVAQMGTLLGSLYGQDRAQASMRGGFRALDSLGKNVDPQRMRAILQGWTRAAFVEGPEFDIGRMFTFAKFSKAAGGALSDRFLTQTLPGLVNDMGESRVGTALGTFLSNVLGNRATEGMMSEQQRLGLRSGFRNRRNPGQFLNGDMAVGDPDHFAWNVLRPALQRDGVDVGNERAVSEAISKIFPQTVADIYSKLINQMEQYQRKARQMEAAAGFDAAQMLAEQDWRVALQAVVAQFRNAIGSLSEPVMNSLLPAMKNLWETMGSWAAWAREKPEEVKAAFQNLAGTVGAIAITLAGLKIASIVAMGSAGPALLWSAGALDRAAWALSAAAGRMGLAGVAGGVAAGGTAAGGAAAGGVAGALARGAMRFLPGVGWVIGGAAVTYGAIQAINEAGDVANGKYWTPANQEEIDGYKARIAELQERLAGIDRRTHPSMRGGPNPERSNIEEELQHLRNKIEAGEQRLREAASSSGQSAGTAAGESMAQGLQGSAPSVLSQMDQIMAQIRARAADGVQINIRTTTVPGTAPTSVDPPGRALGGPVSAGALYRVGEHGEELFRPTSNGTIIPNHRLGEVRGGSRRVAVHMGGITINGGNTDEIMAQIADKITAAARGAFADGEDTWG